MKLAVAGKGGSGKTAFAAWLGDCLARQGKNVWLMDADPGHSLGAAIGLTPELVPEPLAREEAFLRDRMEKDQPITLDQDLAALPEHLRITFHGLNLVAMGRADTKPGGCTCAMHALLRDLIARIRTGPDEWLITDLGAGIEPVAQGAADTCDALVIMAEPCRRSLQTAAAISAMARELNIKRQALVVNHAPRNLKLPKLPGLPKAAAAIPTLASLAERRFKYTSVFGLKEEKGLDQVCTHIAAGLQANVA